MEPGLYASRDAHDCETVPCGNPVGVLDATCSTVPEFEGGCHSDPDHSLVSAVETVGANTSEHIPE